MRNAIKTLEEKQLPLVLETVRKTNGVDVVKAVMRKVNVNNYGRLVATVNYLRHLSELGKIHDEELVALSWELSTILKENNVPARIK